MTEPSGHPRRASGSAAMVVVRPQPITETSLMSSVAGFINEVHAFHQQSTHNSGGHDSKVVVTWARFEKADINDCLLIPEHAELNGNHAPLLLALGYTHGAQVWLIPASGEAREVLSWKQGQVKALKILPSPENAYGSPDNFAHCRPLVVMVDAAGHGAAAFTSASFVSLKTGEAVQNIKFSSEIADVAANPRLVVISFKEKLAAFDTGSLEARFTVITCYPSPGVHVNPIALGDRWLAYADQRLVPIHRSMGGMEMDGSQSVTAWGINVGSRLAQGMSKIYNNIFTASSSTSSASSSCSLSTTSASRCGAAGQSHALTSSSNEPQKGVVTILDICRVYRPDRDEVLLTDKIDGVVAHFIAHNKAIVAMQFDSNGSLLLTCDRLGNYFNLFRIVPHPSGSCFSAVHHLYSLFRGDTPGSVQDIAFSSDSRWVAVSTLRGTTHVFPITPYGGPVGVRTHTSSRVVNRLSRFHRSAGLHEHPPAGRTNSSGRNSPNPTLGSSPVFSKLSVDPISSLPLVIPVPNPHVPPFPTPTLIQPVAQLRQPYLVTLTNQTLASGVTTRKVKATSGGSSMCGGGGGCGASGMLNQDDIPIRLAVTFAPSRAWQMGGASQCNLFHRQSRRLHDSLFVVANHGVLLEYSLDPIPDSTLPKERICESSPIELQVKAFGQWTMHPPLGIQPPLSADNPLMSTWVGPDGHQGQHSACQPNEEVLADGHWLSQVEIVTHVGPHRRLWMGPQFCFKTFRRTEDGRDECHVVDVNVACRPEASTPVNMPASAKSGSEHQVLIEAGSASSMEWNFASLAHRHGGSRDQLVNPNAPHHHAHPLYHDVESELQEAMSETVQNQSHDDSLLDGANINSRSAGPPARRGDCGRQGWRAESSSGAEEEFFCLTPEDARSICGATAGGASAGPGTGGRSRNASATSVSSIKTPAPLQMGFCESKIFSVAVEARAAEHPACDSLMVCDVDTDFTSRLAVVSEKKSAPFVKEVSPKIVEEEVFELATNDHETAELLADALLTLDGGMQQLQACEQPVAHFCRPASPAGLLADLQLHEDGKTAAVGKARSPPGSDSKKAQPMPLSSEDDGEVDDDDDDDEGEDDDDDDDDEAEKCSSGSRFGLSFWRRRMRVRSKKKPVKSSQQQTALCSSSDSSLHEDVMGPMLTRQEGWSFEADDLDINKLIADAEAKYNDPKTCQDGGLFLDLEHDNDAAMDEDEEDVGRTEEKTSLEDIFKFDSELMVNRLNANSLIRPQATKSYAITAGSAAAAAATSTSTDEFESDTAAGPGYTPTVKMSASLNVSLGGDHSVVGGAAGVPPEGNLAVKGASPGSLLSQSLVVCSPAAASSSTAATESSSVGNSPDPKKCKKPKRKKKR